MLIRGRSGASSCSAPESAAISRARIHLHPVPIRGWMNAPRVRRKQLLFLCQMFPLPVQSGTQLRSYMLIQRLARRFDVTLLTLAGLGVGWFFSRRRARHGAGRIH